ncbi:hypothetical protein HPB47_017761 [Ixodes persulcatus]|uniref:Uncharacterized protein n=1 Tax=Ixodes persulcatus TaxID=34615 RepID=A0AC60QMM1_IXOPE|nr:hypothetical protein HPB47_017761 [Ixodes persulcatus]
MTLASPKETEHSLDYGSHSLVSESKAVKALDGPFLKRMDGKAYMTQKNMGWQNLAPEDTVISDSTNQHPKSVVDVISFSLVSWESKTCNMVPWSWSCCAEFSFVI